MNNIVEAIKEELTFENVLNVAIKTPGVKINRGSFLRKELIKYCPENVITEAIKYNPDKAGISKSVINKVSKAVISYETKKVTGISFLASLLSSVAAGAAIGTAIIDITS